MRAVFLDRDGVINERDGYVLAQEQFNFLPGALDALALLAEDKRRKVVIVTNQSPVGRGTVAQGQIDDLHAWMVERITEVGGRVDAVYVCPHAPEDRCWCRKPRPGLFVQAERELGIDLSKSTMVGDMATDMQAAWAAGVGRCYWVMNGQRLLDSWRGRRYRAVESLAEAAHLIVRTETPR